MKNLILSVLLAFPLLAEATPETTVDLQKFATESLAQLTDSFGEEVFAGEGEIYFVDGVYENGEYSVDLATLNFVIPLKGKAQPQTLAVFRLKLGGGILDVREGQISSGKLTYSVAGSVIVGFVEGTTEARLEEIAAELRNVAPGTDTNVMSSIGMMVVNCKPKNFGTVSAFLKNTAEVTFVNNNGEGNSPESKFGEVLETKSEGKLDLNDLRSLSRDLLNRGHLRPDAVVPEHLR